MEEKLKERIALLSNTLQQLTSQYQSTLGAKMEVEYLLEELKKKESEDAIIEG